MTDPGDRTRFIGRIFEAADTLANGETLVIDASDASTNAVEINDISHGDDVDVTIEADLDGDGTYEQSITVDSLTGAGISQGNEMQVGTNTRIVLEAMGSTADYIVTGVETAP